MNKCTDNDSCSVIEEVKNIFNCTKYSYDAINKCKSAGVIPYTIHDGKILFLLQRIILPSNSSIYKKDKGWNDFGGKKNDIFETTYETAAREFSEETSCIFYLIERSDEESKQLLKSITDKSYLYDDSVLLKLQHTLNFSKDYFKDKINEFVIPMYISSKEIYISYFIKVTYVPEEYFPDYEDIHVYYDNRYTRECKWFTLEELLDMKEEFFHKRLQITKLQKKIKKYYINDLFS